MVQSLSIALHDWRSIGGRKVQIQNWTQFKSVNVKRENCLFDSLIENFEYDFNFLW